MEHECFGGKVMKESKWPNGSTNVAEVEQYANALMLFYEKKKPVEGMFPAQLKSDSPRSPPRSPPSRPPAPPDSGWEAYSKEVNAANDTFVRHSFLLDNDLQNFLKSLLATAPTPDTIEMCLNFFFNVVMHSSVGVKTLATWGAELIKALSGSPAAALKFCTELATRTTKMSGNWLSEAAMECTDSSCRLAAANVIAAAMATCAKIAEEDAKVKVWSVAWGKQTSGMLMSMGGAGAGAVVPAHLSGNYSQFEDFVNGAGSCLGVLIAEVRCERGGREGSNIILTYSRTTSLPRR
jgi:ubiquitin carboxyl-terminal hydrolase 9/24